MLRYVKLHRSGRLLVHHEKDHERNPSATAVENNMGDENTGDGADTKMKMLLLPSSPSMADRKALRLRGKVAVIIMLTLVLFIGNVYTLVYLILAPFPPCPFGLHQPTTGCHDVDPVSVFALIGGIVSVLMLTSEIYNLFSTPLYLKPGEHNTS